MSRKYTKQYGAGAAACMRLCEAAEIDGSGRIVTADSWFANLRLARGLRKVGMHGRLMIKGGHSGYPDVELKQELEDKERGAHSVATIKLDGEKFIAVGWRGKSEKARKGKKKKYFMSTFLFTDCTTTQPGRPAEKKRHHADLTRAPSKFISRPRCIEEFYTSMPASDIVNRNAQFLIGIEEAIRTTEIRKRIGCSIVGHWFGNSFGMANKWSPKYTNKGEQYGKIGKFVRDVVLGEEGKPGLFPKIAPVVSRENEDGQVVQFNIDPLVHPLCPFKDVSDTSRQQRCVMCIQEGRRVMTSVYCGYCAVTANRNTDRNPTRHAYCTSKYQCFARHVANCYKQLQSSGQVNSFREDARMSRPVAIAEPMYVVPGKASKKKTKRAAKAAASDNIRQRDGRERRQEIQERRAKKARTSEGSARSSGSSSDVTPPSKKINI